MTRVWISALAVAALSLPAAAQTPAVDAARAAGLVGERFDGYLGIARPASATVQAQVSGINIRRRALYTRLGGSRRVTPSEVGITAGCELLAGVGIGQAYMLPDGVWRRRAPGQPASVPNYCR